MSRKLYKSLKAQKDQTEQVKLTIYGSLGIPLNGTKVVQVAGRQGYVYVRLRDNQNEVIQAFNNRVAASYDLPVIVIREGGRYIVQQFNSQRYLNNAQNSAPFLPGHGTQHSFRRGGGADITWVYAQQIMPGLVYPNSATGTNVKIERYPLLNPNGQWIYAGGTGTQNILQYIPTTGSSSLMTLVYLDAITGNPGILVGSGTYFPANITGSIYPYIPTPSNTQIPLAGVLLNTGTRTIGWDNLYDVRQWVHATPSGTSSGGGGVDTIGVVAWDEGVSLGTGTVLNFVGGGVTASRSGTVINVDIPSSSSFTGTSHNTLFNLQGGQPNEYYHLSSGTFWDTEAGNGWKRVTGSWSFNTQDAPSYVIATPLNVTGTVGVGMKMQLTHQSQTKNFIVTAVNITGSTTYLNLYGGTDYTLNVTGSISQLLYSTERAPFGFPIQPSKWTVTDTDNTNASQSSPSGTGWYNLGSISASMPIGAWEVSYKVVEDCTVSPAGILNSFSTLSTNSFSETNSEFTLGNAIAGTASTTSRFPHTFPPYSVEVTTKTLWRLLAKTNLTSGVTSIAFRGDLFLTVIQFKSAYL